MTTGKQSTRSDSIRWWVVVVATVATAAAAWVALSRIRIDADLTNTIPQGSSQLAASHRILQRHPIVDRVVVDLHVPGRSDAVARLVEAADLVKARLEQSELFMSVGSEGAAEALASLYPSLPEALPVLFRADELQEQVAPRLQAEQVRAAVEQNFQELAELSGVGQASTIVADPLRLRGIVLRRLAALAPVRGARIEGTHIVSADGRHLLLTALPRRSAGNPDAARRLERLFTELADHLRTAAAESEQPPVELRVAGAFRSAADNERILRKDTTRALTVVTLGVLVLLLLCFRRPLLGVLALLPAAAGVACAMLVYALLSPSLSAMAFGFGAALVTITVDQGIVYVAFLDRVQGISGRRASREVLPATVLATVTTAGAFLTLRLSGYPLLGELGTFAALGVVFSFGFVHGVYPMMFRRTTVPPRRPWLPVDRWLRRATLAPGWLLLAVPAVLLVVLVPFARPRFDSDLHALNTVSHETRAAEQGIRQTWGDVFTHVYVFLEADSVAELQAKSDRLANFLHEQQTAGVIAEAFCPSLLFPGPELAAQNAEAWRRFWHPERRRALLDTLTRAGEEVGFSEQAFEEFEHRLTQPQTQPLPIPEATYPLLGIQSARDGRGWVWLGSVQRGPAYDAESFARRADAQGVTVFDGRHFGSALGQFLEDAFTRMLLIIGVFVVASTVLAFIEPALVLTTLAPIAFGLVCTLGTLGWLGVPIGIPGLLLAIVIFGMGIDFAFHFMRGYQRRPLPDAPEHDPVRVGVFLAFASTAVGMLSLALADHAALRGAGISGLLGISYAALGTFLILPPLQRRLFRADRAWPETLNLTHRTLRRAVAQRYRRLHPRVLAYVAFKLRLDPMFPRLQSLLGSPRTLLDVGCGHGVPATWLAVQNPSLQIVGVDPDSERAQAARWAWQGRGQVVESAAPDLPATDEPFDAALMLDVAHYLSDAALSETLRRIHAALIPGGRLLVRDTVPSRARAPRERWLEALLMRRRGLRTRFRSASELTEHLEVAGYSVTVEPTPGREETWFVAVSEPLAPGASDPPGV